MTLQLMTMLATLALAAPLYAHQPTPSPTATPVRRPDACADPNGDGLITVTDGVMALRAAAELSSPCTEFSCDVDDNGAVTVTDGVQILRRAAGFFDADGCPVPSVRGDFSHFQHFRLSRQAALGFCPPVGSVFAATIDFAGDGVYHLQLSVTEERPPSDPGCLPGSNPSGMEDHCLVAVAVPERTLTGDELGRVESAFASVVIEEAQDPFCVHGSIDPCTIDVVEWDGLRFDDFPCNAPIVPFYEIGRLTEVLDTLLP
jgi:hypothetical protein